MHLLRVEVEVFNAGDIISGISNVSWHTTMQVNRAIWVSRDGKILNSADITHDRMTFNDPCAFVRFHAMGLEFDGVFTGYFDYLMTIIPLPVLLGDALRNIMDIARASTLDAGQKTNVFIAVVEHDENGGICAFKGVLPMDASLEAAMFTPSDLMIEKAGS